MSSMVLLKSVESLPMDMVYEDREILKRIL